MKSVLGSLAALTALTLAALLTGCQDTTTPPKVTCSALGTASLNLNAVNASGSTSSLSQSSLNPSTAPTWAAPHVSGHLLVNTTASLSAQSLHVLNTLNARQLTPGLQRVDTPAGLSDAAYAAQLRAAGLAVQPDYLYPPLSVTNDPGFPGQAGIKVQNVNTTVTAHQDYLTRIDIPGAWDVLARCNLGLSGAKTAVLDGGVDTTHADLQGRVSSQRSYLQGGDARILTHATAVAGVIGATANNALGLSGTGQAQDIISGEIMSAAGASTSTLATALADAVSKGAKVINISLGIPQASAPNDTALNQAITNAAKSAVLVAAAGNTAEDVYYPASRPEMIAVGAVGTLDSALACYSARASSPATRALDIVAPGGEGYGACPGATAAGDLLVLSPNNAYALEAGTSFAAPQVAGVAALMRAANPGLSAAQTRTLLLGSVNRSGGLPMLDARAAVTAAIKGQ